MRENKASSRGERKYRRDIIKWSFQAPFIPSIGAHLRSKGFNYLFLPPNGPFSGNYDARDLDIPAVWTVGQLL